MTKLFIGTVVNYFSQLSFAFFAFGFRLGLGREGGADGAGSK
jgi:hypothetical protein